MSEGSKILIYILSFFIPIAGIIIGIIFLNDKDPEKKQVGKVALWVAIIAILLSCICGFSFSAIPFFMV